MDISKYKKELEHLVTLSNDLLFALEEKSISEVEEALENIKKNIDHLKKQTQHPDIQILDDLYHSVKRAVANDRKGTVKGAFLDFQSKLNALLNLTEKRKKTDETF